MFDIQVRGRGDGSGEAAVGSIATYYKRVATDARPMNRLVALAMLATIAAIFVQLIAGDVPRWTSWVSLALVAGAVGLAGVHTVPAAVRLGAGAGATDERVHAARSILRDHVVCFALIATTLVVQLGFAR
jgi:hypothetical protein